MEATGDDAAGEREAGERAATVEMAEQSIAIHERIAGSALIVDDDEGLRELLGMILEDEGVDVEVAANGREALDRIGARAPGLILLDMRMPVMDGWEFCRELERRGAPRPPIVVVTAAADPAQRAEEVRADAWLSKPFERTALLSVVHRFLDAA